MRILMTHPHDGHGEDDTCLDCIRGRVEATTPGPWRVDDMPQHGMVGVYSWAPGLLDGTICEVYAVASEGGHAPKADVVFIAAAPDDVRALLDEVERLRRGR